MVVGHQDGGSEGVRARALLGGFTAPPLADGAWPLKCMPCIPVESVRPYILVPLSASYLLGVRESC